MRRADFITLLEPLDGSATAKRIYRDEHGLQSEPARPATRWFRAVECSVQDLPSLQRILDRVSLESASVFAVRGKIRADADPGRMRRAHVNAPTLDAAAHHWLALDLDSFLPEVSDFASDVGKYAHMARAALPECFADAAAWYQATGSAGVKPGVRLRLVFWLDRPLGDSELKSWADTWTLQVDRALFTPSQPHYLAAPILDGVPDPVPPGERTGTLQGGTVHVPAWAEPSTSSSPHDELAKAARAMARAEDGDRRNTLNRLVFALAVAHGPLLPLAAVETKLVAATVKRGAGDAQPWPKEEIELTIRSAHRDGLAKYDSARAGWRAKLVLDKNSNPRATAGNAYTILEFSEPFVNALRWNERGLEPEWVKPPPWDPQSQARPVTDEDFVHGVTWFQTAWAMDTPRQWVKDGLITAARMRPYDPIQDYLKSLPVWDRTERIPDFFIRHFGCADTELTRAQTSVWFVQAVRRAFATLDRLVQADYLIVLTGRQGIRKSTVLQALCPLPAFFRDSLSDLSSKEARLEITRSWIVELSELTQSKADQNTFKLFVTSQADKFRAPYATAVQDHPRRAVLIGSTNEHEFLTDPTGNRRFWPLVCVRRASLDSVRAERDQLWSEAVVRAERGEPSYLSDRLEAQAERVQAEHREESPAVALVQDLLARPASMAGHAWEDWQLGPGKRVLYPRLLDVIRGLGWDPSQAGHKRQVLQALRELGWASEVRRLGGAIRRVWTAPENWYQEETARAN